MTSSNRHWPSMFKSKPCNNHNHQWQHDINPNSLINTACNRSSFSSACDERSPEPKPRWNPKPEQIRILEAIFNSGMVNPPRDEIRRIRTQLQQYGQVGDANVFYWFQNRKSRSKHKLRLQNTKQLQSSNSTRSSSSKSSGSDSGSSSRKKNSSNLVSGANSASADQKAYSYPVNTEWLSEPGFIFPVQPHPNAGFGDSSQLGFVLSDNSELSSLVQVNEQMHQPQQLRQRSVSSAPAASGPCNFTNFITSGVLNVWSEVDGSKIVKEPVSKPKMFDFQDMATNGSTCSNTLAPALCTSCPSSSTVTVPLTINQGEEGSCSARTTVFINDVAFEISSGQFNVREAFGEQAVLINSSGQPVLTDEWGFTLQPLQHGAIYYLVSKQG